MKGILPTRNYGRWIADGEGQILGDDVVAQACSRCIVSFMRVKATPGGMGSHIFNKLRSPNLSVFHTEVVHIQRRNAVLRAKKIDLAE